MKTKESLFVRLNDPVSPKILYLKKLPKDDKIIAFIYPLSGLEEEFNKRAYQTLRNLRGKISEISIQERGYIVIVSGDSDYFLIHPVKGWEGSMVPPEPQTGRDLKKIIRETAIRGENNFFEYLWYSPDFKKVERKISFVKLYKPLNWYVLGTIYEEDLRNRVKKANMLAGLTCRNRIISSFKHNVSSYKEIKRKNGEPQNNLGNDSSGNSFVRKGRSENKGYE